MIREKSGGCKDLERRPSGLPSAPTLRWKPTITGSQYGSPVLCSWYFGNSSYVSGAVKSSPHGLSFPEPRTWVGKLSLEISGFGFRTGSFVFYKYGAFLRERFQVKLS